MLKSFKQTQYKRDSLLMQLERQLAFETKFGIEPHEIKSIRVRASGYPNAISWVTMKDGTVHEVNGINVKLVLDGLESF
jgi:hypothetical protein